MKFIFSYVKKHGKLACFGIGIKSVGSFLELLIPYVMEHLIDKVEKTKNANERKSLLVS